MINKLLHSLFVASAHHNDQKVKRSCTSLKINQLIEIAYLLSDVAKISNIVTLQAAILHDILEESAMTETELRDQFDDEVVDLVLQLTDYKTLPLEALRQHQIDAISTASCQTKIIKLAVHCSNLASIPNIGDKLKVKAFLDWSEQVASKCFGVSTALETEYKKRLEYARLQLEPQKETANKPSVGTEVPG